MTSETLSTTGLNWVTGATRFQFEPWADTGFGSALDAPDYLPTGVVFPSKDGRALVGIVPREYAYQ